MPRRARIHFVSLHSSLVNLPISIYGPLLERGVRPQNLAVHLTLVSNRKPDGEHGRLEVYVGWTGMASASSLAYFNSGDSSDRGLETIEIDPQYAEGLGLIMGDIVEIGLLQDLSFAKSVATEPITSDDWEIIEIHASHVESTLLSQVRVAVVGQEIDVWVLGRTRVRLRIVSLDPAINGAALLLTTSTEVSIAPKLHTRSRRTESRAANKTSPNINGHHKSNNANGLSPNGGAHERDVDSTGAKNELATKRTLVMRVLPRHSFSSTLSVASSPSADSDLTIAYVSRSTLSSLGGQGPEGAVSTTIHSWQASLRKIKPPQDPSQEQVSLAPALMPAPRILVPNGDNTPVKPSTITNNEILVKWSPKVPIPSGHILLTGVVDGVDEWDLVHVAFIKECDLISDVAEQPAELNSMTSETRLPSLSKHGLAGIDDILSKCTRFCVSNFALHACSRRIRGVAGLLVTGRSGAGKTSLLQAIAKAMQEDPRSFAYTLYIDLSKYSEAPVAKLRSSLTYWMTKAAWHRPSVLILDNIDKVMSAELEHADSFRSRHIAELFVSTFGSSSRSAAPNASGIVLLAAAESQGALHPAIHSAHVFQEVVVLKPPAKDARKDILMQLVRERMDVSNIVQDPSSPLNFTALSTQTEGYSVTDLKDFVARAIHRAAIRSSLHESCDDVTTTLVPDDFVAAQVDFVPLSLRDVKLQKSEVEWADIGGLRETKRVLRETLEWPTKYGPIFAQSPLRLRSGLLLYGYPGCGKTLLASAVAKECGLNFISIKGPELLNKYIGASEKSVRDLFERASAAKPCVLFFDEFDSIAPKRGHDSTGVTDRVVNQMLTQMDGAEGLDGVYVLAATSRPDLIDSALLRPGRLDKSLLCDMPDLEERRDILHALSRKVTIDPDVNINDIALETEGFSGADLQALVYNAHLEVIHDTISHVTNTVATQNGAADPTSQDDPVKYAVLGESATESPKILSRAEESAFQKRLQRILTTPRSKPTSEHDPGALSRPTHAITGDHINRVLTKTRPSVPPEERERLTRIYRAFVSDRSGELPIPPEGTEVGSRVSLM